ncbi:hypothetical protein [Nocardia thailandica]
MEYVAPDQARAALDAVERARRGVDAEVGLPRGYWWAMAGGWVVLGAIGQWAPAWLTVAATVLFGAGHATLASRLLGGQRRTGRALVSRAVAGRWTAWLVIGMLCGFVLLTVAVALGLSADGARHAAVWSAVFVAAVIGFGAPEILRTGRRWVGA